MNRKYMLAIKRGRNDYLPLEWNMLKDYRGEDLTSLEGIDAFTSRFYMCDLVDLILEENIVDSDEKYESFVILYNEKGKNRELKEGVLFFDQVQAMNVENFVSFLLEKRLDKQILNRIDNILGKYISYKEVFEYQFILKNMDAFLQKGEHFLKVALSRIGDFPYELRRKIMMNVYEKVMN